MPNFDAENINMTGISSCIVPGFSQLYNVLDTGLHMQWTFLVED